MSDSEVPDSMKQAYVTPLLKKSDLEPDTLKNYRPVSNLSFLSKALERVVAARLIDYMTENDLHEPLQSAYKAYHSTETALLRVQNDILCALDDKSVVVLVLLDLSAAFDTIDHSILLSRMESFLGITGRALDWFRSYLLGRTQRITIDGSLSDEHELDWAVPQGSVLGALLFLIYLLPLAHLIRSHAQQMHGYADNTQLYLTLRKPHDTPAIQHEMGKLERCLCDVDVWMAQNKLKLNTDKTEVILFGSKQQISQLNVQSICVAGTEVAISNEPVRNLGAMFDSQLKMDAHVRTAIKKAGYHLRNVGKVRNVLTCYKKVDAVVGHFPD